MSPRWKGTECWVLQANQMVFSVPPFKWFAELCVDAFFFFKSISSWEIAIHLNVKRDSVFLFCLAANCWRAQLKLIIKKLIDVAPFEWPIQKHSFSIRKYVNEWPMFLSQYLHNQIDLTNSILSNKFSFVQLDEFICRNCEVLFR